ncbi:probable serine/threonine-protein kinase WNK5 isoform X2 [Elaeis guineensis]
MLRSPDALQRMYSEVHLLSTLHHESIIRYHASWIDLGKRTFNFITEMFTSGTLREYRQRYRRVDIRAIKNWACQILHGLTYLHGHDPPVIHRDLKCDNIFVNGHLGQVKIGDLGLAAVLRGSQSAHSVIGTPEFMAPELYEEDYNELVDVYSFGMCVLEMLSSEYPYSECSNPAQIYKKVTSGKLPDAFYRIQDPEAQRFVGRCLETASRRPSAKELLLDPFLASDNHHNPVPLPRIKIIKNTGLEAHGHHAPQIYNQKPTEKMNDMTITGKLNPENDTIFLKVQIADKEGHVRNVYFPFDIVIDTPMDVANEMVKELEITDREPSEIAEMIAQEISLLVPGWKEGDVPEDSHHVYNYGDEEEDGCNHPFYYLSSPTSSQGSLFGMGPSQGVWSHQHCQSHQEDWFGDDLYFDDDDESSMHSDNYSAVNYTIDNEQEGEASCQQRETQPIHHKQTRCCTRESPPVDTSVASKFHKQCNILLESSRVSSSRAGKRAVDGYRMMRNHSMVDIRSQLLHRTLLQEVNKRLFKTVGAFENIGFKDPTGGSHNISSSSKRDHRKQKLGHTWVRG